MNMRADKSIMESIHIDFQMMKKMGWNINLYLTALNAYLLDIQNVKIPYNSALKDIKELEKTGYLEVKNAEGEFSITEQLKIIFENTNSFNDFFNLYPHNVLTKYGEKRILRTKDPSSISGTRILKKWAKTTKGNPKIQQLLLQGLSKEIKLRTQSNSMGYFQLIETWLNDGTWEKYIDEDLSKNSTKVI